jgi:protein TonB
MRQAQSRVQRLVASSLSVVFHIGLVGTVAFGELLSTPVEEPQAVALEVRFIPAEPVPERPLAVKLPPVAAFQQPKIQLAAIPTLPSEAESLAAIHIQDESGDATESIEPRVQSLLPGESLDVVPVQGAGIELNQAEQTWESQVLAALERRKRYPAAALRRKDEDTVYVHITIDRRGRVLDARIDRSAGIEMLDDEALQLARRASPLPSPPDSVLGERIELIVPVEFFIRNRRRS